MIGGCGVDLKELLGKVLLDGGDKPLQGGCWYEGPDQVAGGGGQACSSVAREWFVFAQVGRGDVVWE